MTRQELARETNLAAHSALVVTDDPFYDLPQTLQHSGQTIDRHDAMDKRPDNARSERVTCTCKKHRHGITRCIGAMIVRGIP